MVKTPAGARTGDTPPTPDNGNVDLNADASAPPTQPQPVADEQKADPLLDVFQAKKDGDETVAPGTDRNGAKKVTVSTSGSFIFQDPYTLEVVEADGTTEVTLTTAVQTALDEGRLVEA